MYSAEKMVQPTIAYTPFNYKSNKKTSLIRSRETLSQEKPYKAQKKRQPRTKMHACTNAGAIALEWIQDVWLLPMRNEIVMSNLTWFNRNMTWHDSTATWHDTTRHDSTVMTTTEEKTTEVEEREIKLRSGLAIAKKRERVGGKREREREREREKRLVVIETFQFSWASSQT